MTDVAARSPDSFVKTCTSDLTWSLHGRQPSATTDSRGDRCSSPGVPPDPVRPARASGRHHVVGGTRRTRRRQRRQGAQGPQLPRQLRHPRRRLRHRFPRLPDPSRARPDARLAGRHRRRRQPRPGARRLQRFRRSGLSRSAGSSTSTPPRSARSSAAFGSATSTRSARSSSSAASRSASSPRPAPAAQDAADALVAAGVTSILNFAPSVISVPHGISVGKVDLAVELQILAYHEQRRASRHIHRTSASRSWRWPSGRERLGLHRHVDPGRRYQPSQQPAGVVGARHRRPRQDRQGRRRPRGTRQHPRSGRAVHLQPHRGLRRHRALPRCVRRRARLPLRARRPADATN